MIKNRIWSVNSAGMMTSASRVQAWVDLVNVSGQGNLTNGKKMYVGWPAPEREPTLYSVSGSELVHTTS